jgi:hypothetical protein
LAEWVYLNINEVKLFDWIILLRVLKGIRVFKIGNMANNRCSNLKDSLHWMFGNRNECDATEIMNEISTDRLNETEIQ